MSIFDQTVSALPGVSWRERDYLAPRAGRPIPEPVQDEPAEAEAPVQAPEAEAGSEDEAPDGEAGPAGGDGCLIPPADGPEAAPVPGSGQPPADTGAAEDEPAEAEAEAGK